MFSLVFGDQDLVLPLALDGAAEARLLELVWDSDQQRRKQTEIARKITDAVCQLLDLPIAVPPSEKQVKYAVSIARTLSLPIPPEALQYRESMSAFLSLHADTYRRRRRGAG